MTASFVMYRDAADEYRWRLAAANGNILAVSSESYRDKRDCLASIGFVKREAPDAPVVDRTGG